MNEELGFVSRIPPSVVARLSGSTDPATGLIGVAEAVIASPAWKDLDEVVVVVRPAPDPLLAVLGDIGPTAHARLSSLQWQLDHASRLRYVGYGEAQTACVRLAARLVERLGEHVRDCTFQAIPRGGHIVLGMLSYALALRSEQLTRPSPAGAPVVVVDDCALSGARFRDQLEGLEPDREVVFAHLYSTPDLRAAIETAEPRVRACLAPELHGDSYAAWRTRWAKRHPRDYWIGHPEPLCFAWNEPDVEVFNPVTRRTEPGWHLVPPDRCLKNRARQNLPTPAIQVQEQHRGPLRPAAHVIYGDLGADLIVASTEESRGLRLTDVAADMWRALVAGGSRDAALTRLAHHYEVEEERLGSDLDRVLATFLETGLLEAPPRGESASLAAPGPDPVDQRA